MEFNNHLANTIIERVGEKKEVWLVFDMDETVAYWKKLKVGDVFSLRPTVIPFLEELLDANIKIHFAIYSNNQKKSKVDTIADTIGNSFTGNPLFHVYFRFYNYFRGNPEEKGIRRLNLNTNVMNKFVNKEREKYNVNKTVESILHGFAEGGHPIEDADVKTHLFFFDDVLYPSIRNVIGENYIQVLPYKGEVTAAITAPSRGTKRSNSGNSSGASKKPKTRKTKRRSH